MPLRNLQCCRRVLPFFISFSAAPVVGGIATTGKGARWDYRLEGDDISMCTGTYINANYIFIVNYEVIRMRWRWGTRSVGRRYDMCSRAECTSGADCEYKYFDGSSYYLILACINWGEVCRTRRLLGGVWTIDNKTCRLHFIKLLRPHSTVYYNENEGSPGTTTG